MAWRRSAVSVAGGLVLVLTAGLIWANAAAGSSTTHVFAPTADAYVFSLKPDANYGASPSLRTDGDPVMRSYLRFDVDGLSGPVVDARIRIYAKSPSPDGWRLHNSSGEGWEERAITFSNAPAFDGAAVGSSGGVDASTWTEADATSVITGDGEFTVVITTAGVRQFELASRESGFVPELIIVTGPDETTTTTPPTSTTTTPPTSTTTALPTSTTTTLPTSTTTTLPTSTTTTLPPPPSGQPEAPIRAAFLYPWFPRAWTQSGIFPFTQYTPSLGFYDSADAAVIDEEMALAKGAGIEVFISSWWGRGRRTDTALTAVMDRIPDSPHPDMKVTVYYEEEGQSNPSVATIVADLEYLADRFFSHPAYLRVDGKPVVFVFAAAGDGSGMAQRWSQAKADFGGDLFVVLKVYPGYATDPNQPDSWHQYGPSTPYQEHLPYSAVVSPGFWHAKEASPRLARDLQRFSEDVERMNNSGAFWHLITTWNQWGEGTSIEPATEFGTDYLDILAGASPPPTPTTTTTTTTPPPTTTTTTTLPPPPGGSVRFVAAGDVGGRDDRAGDVLRSMDGEDSDFFLLLGDLSYAEIEPASAWCTWIKGYFAAGYPIEVVVGNHEDDRRVDGFIRDFTPCVPDRMGATGDYGVEYYFDVGPVRVIMVAADLSVDGVDYRYDRSGARRDWLLARVDEAEAAGLWTVVGMHKVCVTAGNKDCEIGEAMIDDLVAHGVDLILQGHDHDYQRSHQLRCVDVNTTASSCIVDEDSDHRAEAGAVIVISGWVGRSGTDVSTSDSEAGYFAKLGGPSQPGWTLGYLTVTATDTTLTGTWTSPEGGNTDTFTIKR